ncbi:regulatory protein RecX [Fusobacterium russii]|uniref:regulatory protein RecX n=1 Tax=Fusobacterium russii TaxID=854 RepID=UPI0003B5782A|nr:RecX family transcriptional regulator [Fusobacterium russii]
MKKILIKGNKLIFENGTFIYLTKEMFSKFSLKNKEYLNDEELNELMYFRIKLSAFTMLKKRDYFKKEFSDKLIEIYNSPDIVDLITKEFIEKGYLNDIERAHAYANAHSNYGQKKLSYIFYKMGIDNDTIRDILNEKADLEIENIKNLWKKLGNKEYKKKIESLIRKGFVYGDIKKAISSLEEEEEE